MFGQFNLGNHVGDPSYSADQVEGEILGADGVVTEFNLGWTPIEPGTVRVTDDLGAVTHRDDSAGNIVDASGATAGKIDYATGKITFNAAPADGATANYSYDNISANYYAA